MSGTGKINDWVSFCHPQGENVVFPINVPPYRMSKVRISKGQESIVINNEEELIQKIEQLEKQREQAIKLIKDGRFVEALQELENEDF
jgi:prephenate dehydrogenase